jgi:rsbT co-antagonist protein RsbR
MLESRNYMSDTGQTREQLLAEIERLNQREAALQARVSELEHIETALRASEEHIRTEQQQLLDVIREISSPVIPVHDEVLVLPLVGTIDSARSARIMETLLTGVQEHAAEVVIIDITGVPIVDTAVANHLIQATRAATLLGAHCVLVGVSAEVAQTLVQLGVNLSTLVTLSNLQAGITYALARQGREITIQTTRSSDKNSLTAGLVSRR